MSPLIALVVGAAVGAAAAWILLKRRWGVPLGEVSRVIGCWARGDLAAEPEAAALGGRQEVTDALVGARDQIFKALGERKRQGHQEQQKFEALVEAIPDGLVITDLRGDVLHINRAALEVFGVSAEEAQKGRVHELLGGESFRMRLQDILKSRTQAEVLELPLKRAEGAVSGYFKTLVSLFSAPGADELGVLLLLRDVTVERRVDSIKEEFFQAVAHDLRAPLFAMQGYLRLLEKSVGPDRHQKGYFDAIAQSCEKLTLFIQDILDSARIEAGQMKLTVSPIDPDALLERSAALFKPLAEERGVRLELALAEGRPRSVDMDERLMERVFYNLLSNALKFTPRGGAVTASATASGAEHVEFTVADTGPGIPAALRPQIFEKYRQGAAEEPRTGFGLGLNICRQIVRLHGGMIWADSEPGKGSRFTLRVPLKQHPGG